MKHIILLSLLAYSIASFGRNDSTNVVNVRLVPGIYIDAIKENGKHNNYAGACAEFGAAIKNSFYTNIGVGYQYSENGGVLPAYAAFNTTIIDGHVTPYISSGIGYLGIFRNKVRYDGLHTFFGAGVNINVTKQLSIAFYPSYRFAYSPKYGYVNKEGGFTSVKLAHQIGVNVSIKFY